jgi:hypothetical protein
MRQPDAACCVAAVAISLAACRAAWDAAVPEGICPVRWAGGTQLRLVVPAQHIRRVLSLSGLDQLVCIYPSLEAAKAASTPVVALAVVAGPGLGGSRSCGGGAIGHGR